MSLTTDEQFMREALAYARVNQGLTGTNPAVGTVIVQSERIVARGRTAPGGRPHAEPIALAEAGEAARGATAYVTLEPCAHHGVTPPCAEALARAGVARVVTAYVDPDRRVSGRGHAILREAGIEVGEGICAAEAAFDLAGYLTRKTLGRPHVTLKLAVSADGYIGVRDQEVAITGEAVREEVHRMRAVSDAIMVGAGTARVDDPDLTCRLPGLENRSPHRFVLDTQASLPVTAKLVRSAGEVSTTIVSTVSLAGELARSGVRHMPGEAHEGGIALPELLDDMGAVGFSTLLLEGGAQLARSFLRAQLVDRIVVFRSPNELGGGIASPVEDGPAGFDLWEESRFDEDTRSIWERR